MMGDPTGLSPRGEAAEKARLILKLPGEEATRALAAMPVDQQVELVLSLPAGRHRQDLILCSDSPQVLLQAIPEEDFVLTVKEIGESDALPMLELSSNSQMNHLLDLDIWMRDNVDVDRLQHWQQTMLACSAERTMRWIDGTDFELLVLYLERQVQLVDHEQLPDLPDSVASRVISPDNYHHLVVRMGADLDAVQQLIEVLVERDQERFLALLGNLGTTPPAELEEMALRWRTGRLADRGWPDLSEAMDFYQPRAVQQTPAGAALPRGVENAPRYALSQFGRTGLLQAGLATLGASDAAGPVASQLANLINRVIIADGWPPGEVESLHRAARRVSGRLEIGLLELGVLDESTCARTLVSVPLLHVAQAGQAAIVRRLNRARRLVRAAAGLSGMLAAPIPERLVALGRTRPVFVAQPGDPVREFEHPDDLNALDQDLDLLEAALLICQPLHLSLGALPNPFPPGSHPDSRQSLNLQSLLFTLFARDRLGLEPQTLPLPLNRLAGLQSAVATDPDALTAQILDWMQRLTGQTTPGMDRLARQMAGNAIEHILNQHPQTLDPRFVDGLWLLSESV